MNLESFFQAVSQKKAVTTVIISPELLRSRKTITLENDNLSI